MNPSKTPSTNAIFVAEGCDDLPVTKVLLDGNPTLMSFWTPTDAERIAIAGGADVVLMILGDAHPPVILTTSNEVAVESPCPSSSPAS